VSKKTGGEAVKLTEQDVIKLLDEAHSTYGYGSRGDRYANFPKLRTGTGYGRGGQQEIDYFSISLWRSNDDNITSYEIKLNRADFLKEIKDPSKRKYALLWSNQYFFVAPKDMIKPEELPPEAGLYEFSKYPSGVLLKIKVVAPWRDDARPNWNMVRSIARRVSRVKDKEVDALRAEIKEMEESHRHYVHEHSERD